MIDLTPLDVRKKKEDLRRAVRGYDQAQVEAFLDLVAERLEELVGSERSLSERVESMREQLTTYRERERALNEALLAAQELREEARSQSERDAAVRLREAETHAEAILLDADQAIRHSQRRMEDLRARRTQYIRSVHAMMERFAEFVDLEEARLETEPDDLHDLLRKLEEVPQPSELANDPKRLANDEAIQESDGEGEAATTGSNGLDGGPAAAGDDLAAESESGSEEIGAVPRIDTSGVSDPSPGAESDTA